MPHDAALVDVELTRLIDMNRYWMTEAARWEARQKSTARALAWAMIYASLMTVTTVSLWVFRG